MALYLSKNRKRLISLPLGYVYYTSQRYRDDKDRRDLQALKKCGYFKQLGRFVFKRINVE